MQLLASDYDGTIKQYSHKEKEPTVEKEISKRFADSGRRAIYLGSLQDVPKG